MPYQIKKSETIHSKTLAKISHTSKAHWGYPTEWIEHWSNVLTLDEKYLKDSKHHVWHLEKESNEIIGLCSLAIELDYAEVDHLFILPEYLGLGLGKKLLFHALNNSFDSEFNLPIRVVSDPNALNFYRKVGFEQIGWEDSWPKGRKLPVLQADHSVFLTHN